MNEDEDIKEIEEFSKQNLLPAFLQWLLFFAALVIIASIIMGVWK